MPNFQVLPPCKGEEDWFVVEESSGKAPNKVFSTKAVQIIRDCECLIDSDGLNKVPYIYVTGCVMEKHDSFVTLKPIVRLQT